MGILNSEVNYDKIITDLSKCCLKKESCGTCDKSACIVGYAQNCIIKTIKDSVTYVENGSDNIPYMDFKVYNEEDFEAGIAHILKMCRSCKENHFDNCIINIIRNCYEIGLFGETQEYEGSNLRYLNYIFTKYPEKAQQVIDEFHNTEEFRATED